MTTPVDETFAYDEDGNLTQDGSITYTWDAENRLIAVQTRLELGANPTGPDANDKRLEFKYDYRGRRVQKQVSTYNGSTWSLSSTERYVYDAWNVALTLDGNNAVTRKFTWGLDLSGTLQGAGGIGGLLVAKVGSSNYWYFYDGNGNVTQVVSPPGGIGIMIPQPPDGVQAHYEYDPYGNILASTGNFAAANPFRFSTKWFDTETELYYYGYRYYSPRLGRWVSRDPIGEQGGRNLYGFVEDSPIGMIDALGLMTQSDCTKFWNDIYQGWTRLRQDCKAAWFQQQADFATQQALIRQYLANLISQAQFETQWNDITQKRAEDIDIAAKIEQAVKASFELAQLARWMAQVGCRCAAARDATIAIKNAPGFKEAFESLERIPENIEPVELAKWVVGNLLAPGKGNSIFDLIEKTAIQNLYRTISTACGCKENFKEPIKKPADLYRSQSTDFWPGTKDLSWWGFGWTTPEAIPLE